MKAERWREIEEIFHAATDRDSREREAFLDEACAGDEELRHEVESLLAEHERGASLFETTATGLAAGWAKEQEVATVNRTLGHFRILSPLGKGGMGEVYLAEDIRLRRKVALKLLPKFFAEQKDRLRRFEQEARAASALNHPNIVTIYDVGQASSEEGGAHFIATEFVEGRTLRAMMKQGQMNPGAALDLALQVASALEAAHAVGVIHRDVKPENIMMRNDGLVKVLDFGLAKLIRGSGEWGVGSGAPGKDATPHSPLPTAHSSRPPLSTPGIVMGTAQYMSPEQARGLEVDARTDVFSLGVTLYEMIAGRAPFEGATTSDVIAAILKSDPVPLSLHAPETPFGLVRIVNRALRKDRQERYQTIAELHDDLKTLKKAQGIFAGSFAVLAKMATRAIGRRKAAFGAPAIALLAIIGSAIYWQIGRGNQKAIDSIAIIPFANVSNDPEMEYLCEGIPETLINNLSQLPALRVIARPTAFRYKGQEIDPQRVGDDLDVSVVLTGKVTRRADTLIIQADLVRVADGSQLWGDKYHGKSGDIFSVQNEIARKIAETLQLKLSGVERQRLAKRYTDNIEAYRLYQLGRFHWNKYDEAGFRKSIEYFEQALLKDPNCAAAYAGIADAYAILGVDHVRPGEVFQQAKENALKAIAGDDTLAEAYNSLGIVKLFYEWDWAGAEREFLRARELNPNNADVGHFYGHYLEALGRTDDGIRETKRGLDSDPLSLIINAELGCAYYLARQYDQAIDQYRKTLEMDPNFVFTSLLIAQAYQRKKMYREAIAELTRARPIARGWHFIEAELACAYALSGRRDEALKILNELKDRAARSWIDPVAIAFVYIDLGDKDQAFLWLEKACAERSSWIIWLKVEPKFDPLRSDLRFNGLLRRVGLSE